MEVVYLFHESDVVRIPFYDYDKDLFQNFISQGTGVWDNVCREFIFKKSISAEQLSRNYLASVFVRVDEKSVPPVQVFGFWGRAWKQTAHTAASADRASKTDSLDAVPRSELFPEHWQLQLESELRSRKYSPRTLCIYTYFINLLCRTLQKPPEQIRSEDITQFLAAIEKNKNYSASSINLAISAIKFFYKEVIKKGNITVQHRPRQDKRLPVILSKAEIKKILAVKKNLKHRLLLMIMYASGLRVSEVVRLKRQDVDISRKTIIIISGKGRKDRYTIMSEAVIKTLTLYYSLYDIADWIFPGVDPKNHLSIRSAQRIFENAIKEAQIEKTASIHSLRHTFATHLLENGTDIRYIKELLGHSSIRTTERYTHVARRKTLTIISPMDTITNDD